MSVFDHLWWRHNMATPRQKKAARASDGQPAGPAATGSGAEWKGLQISDGWQDKFYADGAEANEARFWGLGGYS